jgi:hypothetical protein
MVGCDFSGIQKGKIPVELGFHRVLKGKIHNGLKGQHQTNTYYLFVAVIIHYL